MIITTYEFHIKLSEGIKPSEISDLNSVINELVSEFGNDQLFEYMTTSIDITHVKLNISKYINKYYMIQLNSSIPELYLFINSFIYKMYKNKVVNKYILYVEDNEYTPELWYPIGNLDLPPSSIYYKIYSINWIVYPLMVQISLRKDYEILDTLLGNMNPKYFEKMKDAYYDEIMNLSDNVGGDIGHSVFNMNMNSDEDFKIRFIHWCNHYAAMNDDNDIML